MSGFQGALEAVKHALASNSDKSLNNSAFALNKRSGFEIAGFLILLSLLAVVWIASINSSRHNRQYGDSSKSASFKTNINSTSTPSANTQQSTTVPSTDTSTSTVTNATGSGVSSSTQMIVNGQSVQVPANGSTQQTIGTPTGKITVNATQNQSGTAHNFNASVTNTNTSISSYSSSSIDGTGGD